MVLPCEAPPGLPAGVCRWRQGKIREKLPSGSENSTCPFVVRHDDFLKVLGTSPRLEKEAKTNAHEGCLYYPDDNAILFTTFEEKPSTPSKVKRLNLATKEIDSIYEDTDFANGMTLDNEGDLLICQQGSKSSPSFIEKLNLKTRQADNVADNWFGRRLNGPNDIVVKSDGSIWFTDPDYPTEQGFGGKPMLKNHVYRIGTDGMVDVVADRFQKPNGLAFSPDESKLYVTDTGFYACGVTCEDKNRPHSVTVFDLLKNGRQLGNRRLFASICAFDGSELGMPDGIKVDTDGRVYVASTDGIHVHNEDGVLLGLIRVAGAANMGFGGPLLDTLYILNDQLIQSVKLRATGAGLRYAGKYHDLPYYQRLSSPQ